MCCHLGQIKQLISLQASNKAHHPNETDLSCLCRCLSPLSPNQITAGVPIQSSVLSVLGRDGNSQRQACQLLQPFLVPFLPAVHSSVLGHCVIADAPYDLPLGEHRLHVGISSRAVLKYRQRCWSLRQCCHRGGAGQGSSLFPVESQLVTETSRVRQETVLEVSLFPQHAISLSQVKMVQPNLW